MSDHTMHELLLAGCTATPLASYLKALGVFRLVGEQKDLEVGGCWRGEQFVLDTRLDRAELTEFFLNDYRPTPILSPWNGGSGFFPNDNQDGFGALATAKARRFRPIAEAIAAAQRELTRMGLNEKPDDDQKPRLLMSLRASADERFLTWLDAAVVLSSGDPHYPPLLGTGGNDGRLDFSNNFLQRLVDLFDPSTGEPAPLAPVWLEQSLYATPTTDLVKSAIGQFAPGQVGGSNATTGFSSDSLINPWDFVLMLEGALLFVTAATRRLESGGQAALAYPFTVHAANGGNGGTSQLDTGARKSRGEMWMPLWNRSAQIDEVRAFLREGRATVGRRPARDGLDFARAIGQLGIDRGVSAFQRYGFMVRNGLAYLATPLGRFESAQTSRADLIADLERGGFLDRLRHAARDKDAPMRLKRDVARLENALFALTRPGGGRQAVQDVLILLGAVMRGLAVSRKAQSAVAVLPELSVAWVLRADDGSAEFHLALALASLADLRTYLAPVRREKGRWNWAPDSPLCVWGRGEFTRNLLRVVERRVVEARRSGGEPFDAYAKLGARLADIHAFLSGSTDDGRIGALLHGLIWVELPDDVVPGNETEVSVPALPASYAVLKPFFAPPALVKKLGRLPEDARLTLPDELPRLLATDQSRKAVALAWSRARIAGLDWPRGDAPQPTALDGPRLLAALSIPVEPLALVRLLPRAQDLQPENV